MLMPSLSLRARPAKLSIRSLQIAICILQSAAVAAVLHLDAMAGGQEPRWIDARQLGPFVCQAAFSLADCDHLLAELPELQRELSRTLGVPAARHPIQIHLFADAQQHQAYLAQHFPNVPYRRALFVKSEGAGAVYAYRQPDLAVDLRHECTHALLHAVLRDVPIWLDEGLAEYFEVPANERAFRHPYFDSLKWNLRLGIVRPIETLEGRDALANMAAVDYRYSWAWVHFMLHGPEPAHRTLVAYLAELRQSPSAGELSEKLALAVPDPSTRLVQHFKHWHE
jgi:hypothetical protein